MQKYVWVLFWILMLQASQVFSCFFDYECSGTPYKKCVNFECVNKLRFKENCGTDIHKICESGLGCDIVHKICLKEEGKECGSNKDCTNYDVTKEMTPEWRSIKQTCDAGKCKKAWSKST